MRMLLQDYLQNNSIESLTETYKVTAKRHGTYSNLILFKYNQIESPMGEPLVQECRGVILDESDNWKIVSRSFNKFFNYGEGHAKPIDWKTARVQEKVDGSLATIFAYDGKWHIATTGTADASGDVNGFGFTFEQLFWKNFPFQLPPVDCNKCFFFELTTPYNKVVVQHKDSYVTLLGGRDVTTKQELTVEEAASYFPSGLKVVKEYKLSSFEDIMQTFQDMSPLTQEGYVVVDGNFNRQKVKHPGYVALHHMRDGLGSMRNLLEIVRTGEITEVIASFPEYELILVEIKNRFDAMIVELEASYEKIKDIQVQKEFAVEACKTKCSSALFSVRAGKSKDIRYHMQKIQPDTVISLLKLHDIKVL